MAAGLFGCGDNPNRQGNSAGSQPDNATAAYTGVDSRIAANESLGSIVVGRETTLSLQESQFLASTAENDLAEAKLGRLAWAKSKDSGIRDLANRLVEDRDAIQDELLKIAANNAILLPYDINARQAAEIQGLAKLDGGEFDREFLRVAIQADQNSLAAFRNAAAQAGDPSIRWFAQNLMWRHREHLERAQRLQAKIARQGEAARSNQQ